LLTANNLPARLELDFRVSALRVGWWLGWAALVSVVFGIAVGADAGHRWLLLALAAAAAAGNLAAMRVPWREWLAKGRGSALLDVWSGALIGFVVLLVGVVSLPAGATAMRLAILAGVVGGTLVVARALRREAAAGAEAAARAELERTFLTEAEHRVKNSLQTAADLLLLGRPAGSAGEPFDLTASRIRSLAAVHRLLSETAEEHVRADQLLSQIVEDVEVPLVLDAEPVTLDAASAQRLGLVANELVTNAVQHGSPPLFVKLEGGSRTRLRVEDAGAARPDKSSGLGLQLVRRMAEEGLGGSFELGERSGGGTRAELVF
jgi:two-component sensor histidine kinase